MRDLLRQYRQMVYLNDLTDAEYMLFTDNVAAAVEEAYPVYTTFVEMPAVNDTVQVYIVTTIVEELNTDARNMRHIFPLGKRKSSFLFPGFHLFLLALLFLLRCLIIRVQFPK